MLPVFGLGRFSVWQRQCSCYLDFVVDYMVHLNVQSLLSQLSRTSLVPFVGPLRDALDLW